MQRTHVHQLDRAQVTGWYLADRLSEKAIADRLGVDRGTIRARLLEWGVPRRGQREANALVGERMSMDQRARRAGSVRALHQSRVPYTEAALRKKAQTVFARQRLSSYERRVLELCRADGVPLVALYPFERFNFDLAVPSRKLAIEIHGGWHGARRKRAQDARKVCAVETAGWALLVFDRAQRWSGSRPSDSAWIEEISGAITRHYYAIAGPELPSQAPEADRDQHRVVGGDRQAATVCGPQLKPTSGATARKALRDASPARPVGPDVVSD